MATEPNPSRRIEVKQEIVGNKGGGVMQLFDGNWRGFDGHFATHDIA